MRVSGLHVHPLKSGGITSLEQADVTPLGLAGDRWLMVVDRQGHFVTQRAHPKLAALQIEVGDALAFRAPGLPDLHVARRSGDSVRVEVWGDWVDAETLDPALDAWVSDYLDDDLRVVRFADHAVRIADQKYASPDDRVGFADGFAVLIATTASLRDLNDRLATPVPMSRFRPNIVVDSDVPWDEDGWKHVRVGAIELEVIKPCGRCVMVNVDQATGRSMGKEPLKTLATFRQQGHRVVFGQNAVPRGVGAIRLGDPVEVLERL